MVIKVNNKELNAFILFVKIKKLRNDKQFGTPNLDEAIDSWCGNDGGVKKRKT